VLPKGHIEPGEGPRVTTVREVREETGHWAKEGLARRRPTRRKGRCPVCRLVSAGAVQRAEGEATRRAATPLASCRCNRAGAQVFPETKALLRTAATKIAEIKSASQAGRITHQT
jgi:ADP-ribose pyrophosphatase YjhB (NUDIX family)